MVSKSGVCPVCGQEVLHFDFENYSFEILTDDVKDYKYPWRCLVCNSEGYETYRRKFTGHIIKGGNI